VEAIEDVFIDAWRMGLRSIAVYRAGSKLQQPLTADED
jgi:ribonucleotide reductase alpha subunit